MKTIAYTYDNPTDAQYTLQELQDGNFQDRDISLAALYEQTDAGAMDKSTAPCAWRGAALDGLDWLVSNFSLLTIPGLGPGLAAGPLAVALVHSVEGSVTSGLTGALAVLGVSSEDALDCLEDVRRGAILIAVNCLDGDAGYAINIMQRHHPINARLQSSHSIR